MTWAYRLLVGCVAVALLYSILATVNEYASGPAVIRITGQTQLTARLPGVVSSVEVKPGDRVEAGHILVRFNDVAERDQLDKVTKESNLQLIKRLQDPLDSSTQQVLASLRAQKALAEHTLEERRLRAPHPGAVSDIRIRPGQQLNSGDKILSLLPENAAFRLVTLVPWHYAPIRIFEKVPALERLRFGRNSPKIPVVQQLAAADCGAASLAMVLGYFGKDVRLDEIRDILGPGRDGANALALINAAKWYGLRGRGVSIEVDDLQYLEPAAILHWAFNHFVVFESLEKEAVRIVDPGFGLRRIPMEEFRKSFTGVALLFKPTDSFKPPQHKSQPLWPYTRDVIAKPQPCPRIITLSLLLQVFGLAVPAFTRALVDRAWP